MATSVISLSEREKMKSLLLFVAIIALCLSSTHLSTAQWIRTNGPCGGYVGAFAVSGTNIFAGTINDGVYLSTNNGTSWTHVNTGLLQASSVSCLAVSGTKVFAGGVSGTTCK